MMKITRFDPKNLSDYEHRKFHADVLALVDDITPEAISTEEFTYYKEELTNYKMVFAQEDEVMKQIRDKTAVINICDDTEAARLPTVLREYRMDVDATYLRLSESVYALASIEGGRMYESFIERLNEIIEYATCSE